MKIFQVITVSEYGGAQTVVANLIKNLSPHHKLFVLYGGEGEAWSDLGDNFVRIKLCKHRKEASWKDIILFLKLIYYRLRYRPDVVQLHSSKMGVLGRIAFNPKKIVYTLHGFDSVRKAYPKFLIVEKKLRKRSFRTVAVSQYDVAAMKEEGIYENVTHVYNGITDNRDNKENIEDPLIVQKLNEIKGQHRHLVMCISRISRQKKFDLFKEIADRMPQHAFVWIGNKYQMADLPKNVFCLGETPSAFMYLRYADVFILPTNYEGLPISLLESLSFGIPIVASDVGGIGEIVNNKNGFAVENDSAIFEEKINYILADADRYKQMSDNARQTYLEKFSIDRMVDGYLEIFENVVRYNK